VCSFAPLKKLQSGSWPLRDDMVTPTDEFSFLEEDTESGPLLDSIALQQYILLCPQVLEGGFKDKPGKYRDYYHSCYCLSGLSACQHESTTYDVIQPKSRSRRVVH
jgi:hypothetical protein